MNKIQKLGILILTGFLISCSSNKILFPTQLQFSSNAQIVLNEFIPYIQSKGYTILNINDTRMTMSGTNGFLTAEYLETDWLKSGVFNESSGNEYLIKQKVWIILDSGMITIESVVGYIDNGKVRTQDNSPPELYSIVSALPEGLRNLVASKSL